MHHISLSHIITHFVFSDYVLLLYVVDPYMYTSMFSVINNHVEYNACDYLKFPALCFLVL